jgi:hypothetical protein
MPSEEQLTLVAHRIPSELKPTNLVGDGDPAEEITPDCSEYLLAPRLKAPTMSQ